MAKCPTCGDEFDSERAMKAHHQYHSSPYFDMMVREKFNMEPDEFLKKHHRKEKKPLAEVAEMFGGTEGAVTQMAERWDVETLSRSEAKKAEWDRIDEEARAERLDKAHQKTRELVDSGSHNFQDPDFNRVQPPEVKKQQQKQGIPDELREWIDQNPDKLSEYASLGADAREKNGMAGVTGQDHPSWRGGKSIYDAVKKQLPGNWNSIRDEYKQKDGYVCQNCGCIGKQMHSHHIVPLLSGGTNEAWNAMTLCRSCHSKTERYIRQYPEFEPVLVE